jgi:hypothetical protein
MLMITSRQERASGYHHHQPDGHPNVAAGTMVDDKQDAGAKAGDEAEARTEDADDHQPGRTCAPRLPPDGHPNVAGTMVDDIKDNSVGY